MLRLRAVGLTNSACANRFHPPLIYGRKGDPAAEESEGIAVCRVDKKSSSKTHIFCLITYTYPTLSARAVPQLKDFCESYRTSLLIAAPVYSRHLLTDRLSHSLCYDISIQSRTCHEQQIRSCLHPPRERS